VEDNAWLKKLVAELSLYKAVLQDVLQKYFPTGAHEIGCRLCDQRPRLQPAPGLSLTQQHRSTQRKVLRLDPRAALRQRMHEIVLTRLRFGYRRVHILLKREGWQECHLSAASRRRPVFTKQKTPRRGKMAMRRQARYHQPGPTKLGVWILSMTGWQVVRNCVSSR